MSNPTISQKKRWTPTNIYIRAQDKGGNFKSFDIANPELPDESLVLWLSSKDEDYLIRLILILLGREVE